MGGRLSLNNISINWNGFSLSEINLELKKGEYFVLVGPTGSGKTLLLETINGFHELDVGRILHDDKDITELPPDERGLGYVPQIPNLSDELTVRENIEFILRRRGMHETRKKIVDGIIEMMGLIEMQDRLTITLSGGEKRKVSLARALVLEPKTLLLDEPFSNLDVAMKTILKDELRMIHRYLDLTVIHVTHDQREALSLADRLGVLNNGRLVNEGTIEEIYNEPTYTYAATFLGYENIFPAKLYDELSTFTKVKVNDIIIRSSKSPKNDEILVGIHNDEINVNNITPDNVNDNIFRAQIKDHANMGPIVQLVVDIGFELNVNITKRQFLDQELKKGEKVWVSFGKNSVKLLTEAP